jgi:hypothetical protein
MRTWFEILFGYPTKKEIKLKKRRELYRHLNTIPLPKRNPFDLKAIEPKMFYVIWEKQLTRPRVMRYSFISRYFALVFCQKRLKNYAYNIMRGEELLSFGMTHARTKLIHLEMDGSKDGTTRYSFPDGMPAQNKKTQRTLYRRNLRRLLNKNNHNE